MTSQTFSGLSDGFRFILAWMKNQRMLDSLQQVKASYIELADSSTKQVRAIITVPWDPSTHSEEVKKIEIEARSLYSSRNAGSSAEISFQYLVNPEVKEGYMFEIDNVYVNKSAAALAASSSSAAKDQQKDWTAMPALPTKAVAKDSPLLFKLIGAELDTLAAIDDAERRYGA